MSIFNTFNYDAPVSVETDVEEVVETNHYEDINSDDYTTTDESEIDWSTL